MSRLAEIISRYYKKKIYSIDDVKAFVKNEKITIEEYKEITNENYTD